MEFYAILIGHICPSPAKTCEHLLGIEYGMSEEDLTV